MPDTFVPIDITKSDSTTKVYAEPTAAQHLFIAPGTTAAGGYAMHYSLTHGPTGLALIWDASPDKLRAYAEKLAHLDWSFTTKEQFASDELAPLRTEAKTLLRDSSWTDPSAVDLPAHDGWGPDGKGQGLPRAAIPAAQRSLEELQNGFARLHGDDDAKRIPMDIPDAGSPRGVKPNPEFLHWIIRNVQEFGIAYLLLVLHRVDPQAGDSAAAWLADQWEAGDSLGEWAWEWHQALIKGEQLEVPGVPHLGPLLAEAAQATELAR